MEASKLCEKNYNYVALKILVQYFTALKQTQVVNDAKPDYVRD